MAIYNLNYSGGMAQSQNIFFYENISSMVDSSLIDNGVEGDGKKTIIFLIRGRKTNWIRSIPAYATISEGTYQPTYDFNDRRWILRLTCIYPTSSNITTYDTGSQRYSGIFVVPINETYDIKLYYGAKSLRTASLTEIPGINIVLNVSVDETFTHIDSNNPTTYYTQYATNDLLARDTAGFHAAAPNKRGLPVVADASNPDIVLNTDAEYGVQTWTPDY